MLSINESTVRSRTLAATKALRVSRSLDHMEKNQGLPFEEKLLVNAKVTSILSSRSIYAETDEGLRCVFLFLFALAFPQIRFCNEKRF